MAKQTSYQRLKIKNSLLQERIDILTEELTSVVQKPASIKSAMIKARVNLNCKLDEMYWLGSVDDTGMNFNGFVSVV